MGLSELELYNRRQEELRREAENRRLSRALRQERPRDVSGARSGQGMVKYRRAIAQLPSTPIFGNRLNRAGGRPRLAQRSCTSEPSPVIWARNLTLGVFQFRAEPARPSGAKPSNLRGPRSSG
jgi:hypothetical protein